MIILIIITIAARAWVGRDVGGDGAVLAAEVGEEAAQVHRRAVLLLSPCFAWLALVLRH